MMAKAPASSTPPQRPPQGRVRPDPRVGAAREPERAQDDQVEEGDGQEQHPEGVPRGDGPAPAGRLQPQAVDLHPDDLAAAVRQLLRRGPQLDRHAVPRGRGATHIQPHRLPVRADAQPRRFDAVDQHGHRLLHARRAPGAEPQRDHPLALPPDALEQEERGGVRPAVGRPPVFGRLLRVEVVGERRLVRAADVDGEGALDLVRAEEQEGAEREQRQGLPAAGGAEPGRRREAPAGGVAARARQGCGLGVNRVHR